MQPSYVPRKDNTQCIRHMRTDIYSRSSEVNIILSSHRCIEKKKIDEDIRGIIKYCKISSRGYGQKMRSMISWVNQPTKVDYFEQYKFRNQLLIHNRLDWPQIMCVNGFK